MFGLIIGFFFKRKTDAKGEVESQGPAASAFTRLRETGDVTLVKHSTSPHYLLARLISPTNVSLPGPGDFPDYSLISVNFWVKRPAGESQLFFFKQGLYNMDPIIKIISAHAHIKPLTTMNQL